MEYQKNFGFKTLSAARARRRRIFDVGYLFNEIILDAYLSQRNISTISECNNADEIFINAAQLYNSVFTKEEKIALEETEEQKAIENEIHRKLLFIDVDKFFDFIS